MQAKVTNNGTSLIIEIDIEELKKEAKLKIKSGREKTEKPSRYRKLKLSEEIIKQQMKEIHKKGESSTLRHIFEACGGSGSPQRETARLIKKLRAEYEEKIGERLPRWERCGKSENSRKNILKATKPKRWTEEKVKEAVSKAIKEGVNPTYKKIATDLGLKAASRDMQKVIKAAREDAAKRQCEGNLEEQGGEKSIENFANGQAKKLAVLSVFKENEVLDGVEITKRLRNAGYMIKEGEIVMYIYTRLEHESLDVVSRKPRKAWKLSGWTDRRRLEIKHGFVFCPGKQKEKIYELCRKCSSGGNISVDSRGNGSLTCQKKRRAN